MLGMHGMKHKENVLLSGLGLTDIIWHGRVSYIAINAEGEPVCGVVYQDIHKLELSHTVRAMRRFDYDALANWTKTCLNFQ